ncbi:MAG TPA: hypothetical protein GXZ95_01515 [Mollicutes bacterium]|nr:hypothetical protein [Mollicutes bacterium]
MLVRPIDIRKTKKLVEKGFKIYNRYLLSIADDDQFLLDEKSFEIKLDISDRNISDKEKEKLQYVQYIISRYNRLCVLDRKIIYYSYMIKEKNNDGFTANNLGFDSNYFYRKKKEAIINMAYALNAEIYEGEISEID